MVFKIKNVSIYPVYPLQAYKPLTATLSAIYRPIFIGFYIKSMVVLKTIETLINTKTIKIKNAEKLIQQVFQRFQVISNGSAPKLTKFNQDVMMFIYTKD
ncbi:hypothetical protein IQ265_06570 [Nodosilinea sp. LEGE 06152]|uniref:hypothetical protein n=1 Tax=Nodosilinea sp. LEGE 06152 TaxID=2777966 RepID=UPI00187F1551|nr:hypothetical protein [Nodosilinea sp. LEGE 06152]MBE9156493.1 hypothetical protein [Nodosilinea sp. LEGE 06152]